MTQQVLRVVGAALDAVGPERVVIFVRDCAEAAQFLVGLVVTGKQRQRNASVMEARSVLFGPVFPVANTAKYPRDDKFGFGCAFADMQVH